MPFGAKSETIRKINTSDPIATPPDECSPTYFIRLSHSVSTLEYFANWLLNWPLIPLARFRVDHLLSVLNFESSCYELQN